MQDPATLEATYGGGRALRTLAASSRSMMRPSAVHGPGPSSSLEFPGLTSGGR